MSGNDYYQILQIQPNASAAEIRKAYRQLALEFHPDKNNSQLAAAQFVLINEAYAVLSNPAERRKYDAAHITGQITSRKIATTPAEIRRMSEELMKSIQRTNPDRINIDKLVKDLEAILSVYHIQLLEKNKDDVQLGLIIDDCLFCLAYTDLNNCMNLLKKILEIKGLNQQTVLQVQAFQSTYLKNHYWNRFKILFALLIAIIFCFLLYQSR